MVVYGFVAHVHSYVMSFFLLVEKVFSEGPSFFTVGFVGALLCLHCRHNKAVAFIFRMSVEKDWLCMCILLSK